MVDEREIIEDEEDDDDDLGPEFSDDPEVRREYMLEQVRGTLETMVQSILSDLGKLVEGSSECLNSGRAQHTPLVAFFALAGRDIPQGALQERFAKLGEEIRDIVHEKGFRFGGLTANEHRKIGSTVWVGYNERDPDVPLEVLNVQLEEEGIEITSPSMTIEEADRARRLGGHTRLNLETGRVTDEIDELAANDSFYFLSAERRAELVLRQAEILEEVRKIAEWSIMEHKKNMRFVDMLDAYSKGILTRTQIMQAYQALNDRLGEHHSRNLSTRNLSRWIDFAQHLSFATGSRDEMLSPQEISLRFNGVVAEVYCDKPYTPLAIQDGVAIEVVQALRANEPCMSIDIRSPYDESGWPFKFRLEELDAEGKTVKSPTFVNSDDPSRSAESEEFISCFQDSLQMPFSREGEWHYRENASDES